jgi:hypothetical protein
MDDKKILPFLNFPDQNNFQALHVFLSLIYNCQLNIFLYTQTKRQ